MNLDLTHEEIEFSQTVEDICKRNFAIDQLRASKGTINRLAWNVLGDSGVFGLCAPESISGLGLPISYAIVVCETMGRFLVPKPVIDSISLAPHVREVLSGAWICSVTSESDGLVVVEHYSDIDALALYRSKGLELIDFADLDVIGAQIPLDPLCPVGRLEDIPTGRVICKGAELTDFIYRHEILRSAYLVGIASQVLELAVQYAKSRNQFSRPIGSFQAIKHLLADGLVRAELARAQLYVAGVTFDEPECGNLERAVYSAKLLATQAAVTNSRTAIQVFGGMGFTWEVDVHLFLKRALLVSGGLVSSEECCELLAGSFYEESLSD